MPKRRAIGEFRVTDLQSTETAPPAADPAEAARKRRAARIKPVGLALLVAMALGGLYLWYSGRDSESTDDAYTDGRAMTISPRVAGNVISLDVSDNQFVN